MIFWIASFLLFQLSRLFFLIRTSASFEGTSFWDLTRASLAGLRFDLSVLSYIFLLSLAIKLLFIFKPRIGALVSRWVTVLAIATCFLSSLVDAEYFFVNRKRLDASIFKIANDIHDQIYQYFTNYAYVAACWFVVAFLFWHLSSRQVKTGAPSRTKFLLSLLVFVPLAIVGARGGLQEKPLKISNSLSLGDSKLADLALNAPFVLMQTFGKIPDLTVYKDFRYDEARHIVRNERPLLQKPALDAIKNIHRPGDNVVLIILESFGNEYSYATPFFNRLRAKSLSFERHFANGRTSIEAVPSLFAALPALLPQPYITSPFSTSRLQGLPAAFGGSDRDSIFLHGARKGSMYFDAFTAYLGFNAYFGKEDYDGENSALYDWGVHDHAFLRFAAKKLSNWPKPFFASIFTLSSHQPYEIPAAFEKEIPKERDPFVRSLRYADRSLEMFFNENQDEEWFRKTLFILTGDHTSHCENKEWCSELGLHSVPLLIYHGSEIFKPQKIYKITQHADIPATIAAYLGLSDAKLLPFGHSVFDPVDGGEAVFRDHHDFELAVASGYFKLHDNHLERCDYGPVAEINCREQKSVAYPKEDRYLRALRSYFTQSLERRNFEGP